MTSVNYPYGRFRQSATRQPPYKRSSCLYKTCLTNITDIVNSLIHGAVIGSNDSLVQFIMTVHLDHLHHLLDYINITVFQKALPDGKIPCQHFWLIITGVKIFPYLVQ